jgi:hypothetical protein
LHLWQLYHLSINQQVMLGANSLNPDMPSAMYTSLDQWACVINERQLLNADNPSLGY